MRDEWCILDHRLLFCCSLTKPEFIIVIFIHCKSQIAVAILALQWMKMTQSGWQMKKKKLLLLI